MWNEGNYECSMSLISSKTIVCVLISKQKSNFLGNINQKFLYLLRQKLKFLEYCKKYEK